MPNNNNNHNSNHNKSSGLSPCTSLANMSMIAFHSSGFPVSCSIFWNNNLACFTGMSLGFAHCVHGIEMQRDRAQGCSPSNNVFHTECWPLGNHTDITGQDFMKSLNCL